MSTLNGPRLRTISIAVMAVWALLLAGLTWVVVTDQDPTPTQQAFAACRELGDGVRVSILADDGDDTWTVAVVVGGEDTLGRSAEEVQGQPAEVAYPGQPAEDLRDLARQVLEDDEPLNLSTVVNDVEITTRIVPLVPGVAAFCSAIGGTPS